jgi:hypothetical protein
VIAMVIIATVRHSRRTAQREMAEAAYATTRYKPN